MARKRLLPPPRPRAIQTLKCQERRVVVTLVGGIVQSRETRDVEYQEAWYGTRVRHGRRHAKQLPPSCSHVVLDTKTRGRMDILCPDCVPPIPSKRRLHVSEEVSSQWLRQYRPANVYSPSDSAVTRPLIIMSPGSMFTAQMEDDE